MKSIIFLEMVTLFGGYLIIHRPSEPSFLDLMLAKGTIKSLIATVVILGVLMTLAEAGQEQIAASFGGLIVLGYLLHSGGVLGPLVASQTKSLGQT